MKRVVGLVIVLGASSFAATDTNALGASVALAASKTPPVHKLTVADLAPADEYFGPLKQSVIGMRNTIRDLGLRYDVNHDIGRQTVASALLTEGAIRDWQRKYPRDDQLPKTLYLLQRLYTKVLTTDGRSKAKATAQWLLLTYSSSPQAKQLRKVLASEHLEPIPTDTPLATLPDATSTPLVAPVVPAAPAASPTSAGPGFVTPTPSVSAPSPSVLAPANGSTAPATGPSATPGAVTTPVSSATPASSATPTSAPTPLPSVTPAATPSPSPSPTPSATPRGR